MLKAIANEFGGPDAICADFSGALIQWVTEFRNEPNNQTGCFESAIRKVVTELSYPVLMVAVVVEHLVRIALSLLCFIPSFCIDGGDAAGAQFFYSITVLPDHLIRCGVGMFKNIFVARDLNYNDLNLCTWRC